MAKKTKKVVLFIVEGPADEFTLSPVFKKIFQTDEVRFHVVHGDVATDLYVSTQTAVITINDYIDQEMSRYGFELIDILQIIHLVDTDGAFIPNDKVVYGEVNKITYFEDKIEHSNPQKIIDRNVKKSSILHLLSSKPKIKTKPYKVFYFSRNLEHVMHNIIEGLTDVQKEELADIFADKFCSDPNGFIEFISSNEFVAPGNYSETWQFIYQGINSLRRYSNLHLLFKDSEDESI